MTQDEILGIIEGYKKRISQCEKAGKVDLILPDRIYLRGSEEYTRALINWRIAQSYYERLLRETQ